MVVYPQKELQQLGLLFSDTLAQLRLNPLVLTKTSPVPTGFLVRKPLLSSFRQATQAAWQAGSTLHELNKHGGASADINNLIQTWNSELREAFDIVLLVGSH